MKILVKGNNWLGDAVMSLPLFEALKKAKPRAQVSVLTRTGLAELYQAVPSIDEVIPYAEAAGVLKRSAQWLKLVRALKRQCFDVAIVLPRSFSSALTIFSARIPRRIGYDAGRGTLLTDALPREPRLLSKHRAHYFHHLLSPLMEKLPPPPPPRLVLDEAMRARADALLHRLGIEKGAPLIGFHPGATYGNAKQWYPERFAEMGRKLARKYATDILIFGGSSEVTLAAKMANLIGAQAHSIAGKTSVLELAALIERCALFITNDTGPMHIADALGVPIVAIFGSTNPQTTGPFHPHHTLIYHAVECSPCYARTCPLGHHKCMDSISVSEVLNAASKWLNHRP